MTTAVPPHHAALVPPTAVPSADVLAAVLALDEGLQSLRVSMESIMRSRRLGRYGRLSRAVRGDGGVPKTRQRPSPNEPPPRPAHTNTKQVSPKAFGVRQTNVPAAASEAETSNLRDAIPVQTSGPDGDGRRQAPARPDPGDAAAEVWELIERAQSGDGTAFGLLYDRYFDTVFRFVYFRVGNRQLAEDLTSDTFLRALKRIGSFTWQGRDLGAWLVTIARNLVADHFKSGRYRLEVTTGDVLDADRPERGPEGSPEAAVIDHITNVDLLRAVKQLNPEQQECIVLRFLHGFSVAETARTMGKNEGAIKALQYRAVRALARLLPEGFRP